MENRNVAPPAESGQHAYKSPSIMHDSTESSLLCFTLVLQNTTDLLRTAEVSWNDHASPRVLKVHLKKSKCDQLGQGVDVFVGRTHCPLCPVMAGRDSLGNLG